MTDTADRAEFKERLREHIQDLESQIEELEARSDEIRAEIQAQRARLNEIKTEFALIDAPTIN